MRRLRVVVEELFSKIESLRWALWNYVRRDIIDYYRHLKGRSKKRQKLRAKIRYHGRVWELFRGGVDIRYHFPFLAKRRYKKKIREIVKDADASRHRARKIGHF